MSVELVNLSHKVKNLSLAEHSILNVLAFRANDDHECWPSIKSLSENTSADRKTIIKAIDSLIEKKLLIDTGKKAGKTKRVPVYKLTLNSPKIGTVQNLNSTTFSGNGSKNGTIKQYQKRDMERSVIKDQKKEDFSLTQEKEKRQKNYKSNGMQSVQELLKKLVES